MSSKLFLLVCFATVAYSVNMRLYDTAGDYVLKPEDYGYQDNIIIELWGAGSGSTKEYINNGYPTTYSSGGNSGAYINAKIDTTNQETFYFTLGAGGNCSLCTGNKMVGGAGNYSLFYTTDKELFLNVSGGYASEGIVNSTKHRADDIILSYYNGTFSPISQYSVLCAAGQSPFGPTSNVSYKKFNNNCDGYMGSGSGCGCCGCSVVDGYGSCIKFYKGGDGALVVYY